MSTILFVGRERRRGRLGLVSERGEVDVEAARKGRGTSTISTKVDS